jgi:hypothetical protein
MLIAQKALLLVGLIAAASLVLLLCKGRDEETAGDAATASSPAQEAPKPASAPTEETRRSPVERDTPGMQSVDAHVIGIDRARGVVVLDGGTQAGLLEGLRLSAAGPDGAEIVVRVVAVQREQAIASADRSFTEGEQWFGRGVRVTGRIDSTGAPAAARTHIDLSPSRRAKHQTPITK